MSKKNLWDNFLRKKNNKKFLYKKIIKNYLQLDRKYKFNQEINTRFILKQISNIKKKNKLNFLPVGIKDNINTEILSTNFGLKSKKKFMIGNNARVVDKLVDLGGIIFSKTTCAEFAVHDLKKKFNINPHDSNHIAGTSSTGSAISVATGALPITIGTQTAGSIMRPSSYCGVYGFKPTFGSIDRTGVLKTNDLFDTIGLLSSSINLLELVFKNIHINGTNYPWTQNYKTQYHKYKNKKKIKIGIINEELNIFKKATQDVKQFYNNFKIKLKNFDLSIVDVSNLNKFHRLHDVLYKKSVSYYLKNYTSSAKVVGPKLKRMILEGKKVSTKNYNTKLDQLNNLINLETIKLTKYDFIIVPTTFSKAPLHNKNEKDDCCLIWTALKLPCITIPFFKKNEKLPYGMMITSRMYNDYALLDFAKKISAISF